MSRILTSLRRLVQPNVRQITTGEKKFANEQAAAEIKRRQNEFQIDDDKEVHIKTGKTHFYVTVAVGAAALISGLNGLYRVVTH